MVYIVRLLSDILIMIILCVGNKMARFEKKSWIFFICGHFIRRHFIRYFKGFVKIGFWGKTNFGVYQKREKVYKGAVFWGVDHSRVIFHETNMLILTWQTFTKILFPKVPSKNGLLKVVKDVRSWNSKILHFRSNLLIMSKTKRFCGI